MELREVISNLPQTEESIVTQSGISTVKYYDIEQELVEHVIERAWKRVPYFRYTFTYISPKGRNHYSCTFDPTVGDIEYLLNAYKKEEKNRSNAQIERSLMTPGLRYDVMRRDGFHCVLCGRGQEDGVKLHVDHIVPVAKGGRTERSNLRTLCEDCNRGKRDKYDPNGYN